MTIPRREVVKGLASLPAPSKTDVHGQSVAAASAGPTVSELRAKQKVGDLPLPCRGRDCTVQQLIGSVASRFRVLHRDLKDGDNLAGKSVLVLLPEQNAHAIAQAQWLLDQHGDFSGRTGQVVMNAEASRWLGNPKGIVQLDTETIARHAVVLSMIEGEILKLAALVKREKLGAPPRFKGASLLQMQLQFKNWLTKASANMKVFGALNEHGQKLNQLHEQAAHYLLPNFIAGRGKIKDLTVTVLAGRDAAVNCADPDLAFAGLIITPADVARQTPETAQPTKKAQAPKANRNTPSPQPTPWTASDLTASLQQEHKITVNLLDLLRRPIAGTRSLNGVLLVLGVEGELIESVELASRLLEVLQRSPSGEVPVKVLQIAESLPLSGKGHSLEVLADPKFGHISGTFGSWKQSLDRLLDHIAQHPVQEPIDPQAVEAMGHQQFTAIALARVTGMGSLREQGLKLLQEYEAKYEEMSQLHLARWRSVFTEALKTVKRSDGHQGVHLLAMPLESARYALAILRETPSLVNAMGQSVIVTKVSHTAIPVALAPEIKMM